MSENPVISSREARFDLWHGRFPAYTLFHMFVTFTNSVYIRQQSTFFKIGPRVAFLWDPYLPRFIITYLWDEEVFVVVESIMVLS